MFKFSPRFVKHVSFSAGVSIVLFIIYAILCGGTTLKEVFTILPIMELSLLVFVMVILDANEHALGLISWFVYYMEYAVIDGLLIGLPTFAIMILFDKILPLDPSSPIAVAGSVIIMIIWTHLVCYIKSIRYEQG